MRESEPRISKECRSDSHHHRVSILNVHGDDDGDRVRRVCAGGNVSRHNVRREFRSQSLRV